MLDPATSRVGSAPPTASPVVVKPGAVAGDDDVVGLLRHVVLAGVHQTVDFSFTLFFIILQESERARERDQQDGGNSFPPDASVMSSCQPHTEFLSRGEAPPPGRLLG